MYLITPDNGGAMEDKHASPADKADTRSLDTPSVKLVTLTEAQIIGLHCGWCGSPLVTRQFIGNRIVLDAQGNERMAEAYVCVPTCQIADALRAKAEASVS